MEAVKSYKATFFIEQEWGCRTNIEVQDENNIDAYSSFYRGKSWNKNLLGATFNDFLNSD
jgi:hypothetical protein